MSVRHKENCYSVAYTPYWLCLKPECLVRYCFEHGQPQLERYHPMSSMVIRCIICQEVIPGWEDEDACQ